jgi:hypothetical protein
VNKLWHQIRRFFPNRQQRLDAAKARQIIEDAWRKSREPKGCAESVKSGAEIRDHLLSLVDEIEEETGEPGIIFAADKTLVHPRLIEALEKRQHDGELLRLAIDSCFVNPNFARYMNETWATTVKRYRCRPNNEDLIREKACILALFVVHNLGTAIAVRNALATTKNECLTEEQQTIIKIEEAACWYRVIDELAYRFIREHRPLFADFFAANLAKQLALQGAPPSFICRTMTARSEEYARYREWATDDINGMAKTLLWNAAKHVAVPLGFEPDILVAAMFGTEFVERVKRALVYELLTGNE